MSDSYRAFFCPLANRPAQRTVSHGPKPPPRRSHASAFRQRRRCQKAVHRGCFYYCLLTIRPFRFNISLCFIRAGATPHPTPGQPGQSSSKRSEWPLWRHRRRQPRDCPGRMHRLGAPSAPFRSARRAVPPHRQAHIGTPNSPSCTAGQPQSMHEKLHIGNRKRAARSPPATCQCTRRSATFSASGRQVLKNAKF